MSDLSSPVRTDLGQKIGKRLGEQVGQLFDSFMEVYRELYQKKFDSPSQLQEHFRYGDKPVFTNQQAETIYKQLGGRQDSTIINEGVQSLINFISGIEPGDASNMKIQETMEKIQLFIRTSLPAVFTLNTLEKSPLFGDILASALDITAAALPVLASVSQTQTPILVGLLPLPYASTVGLVAGWIISFFFLFTAMLIGISRKDFSAAVESTAGMIPVLGPVAMRTVTAVDRTGTKLRNRAQKIYDSVERVYGKVINSLDTAQRIAEGRQVAGFKKLKKTRNNRDKCQRKKTLRKLKKH